MIRHLILIMFVSFVLGTDSSMYNKKANNLFPVSNKFSNYPVLDMERRRLQTRACFEDILTYKIRCLSAPDLNCDRSHTKWVIQIHEDTEQVCYPSSCHANDLHYIYSLNMERENSASEYCTLDCPAIEINIRAYSNVGESMNINGKSNYADVRYECAKTTSYIDITQCHVTGACPSNATGKTTCTRTLEDRKVTYKSVVSICLPNECTDDTSLEKMEDFMYAFLTHLEKDINGLDLTREQIRDIYLAEYSCSDSEDRNEPDVPSHNFSKEALILISGALVVFIIGLILYKYIYIARVRRGELVVEPTIAIEFHNRKTDAVARTSVIGSPDHCDRGETGIIEVT